MLVRVWKAAQVKARTLYGDESGVTAIEYGLIAGAIAVAIIVAVLALGENIEEMFEDTSGALEQAGGG
ncbi:MAG: Flp family type IVb pilin [Alphaproteobacteria bacterium]|nr:Flp family type IVb pilin [Alphaproteobacteria bacterium]